MLKQFRLLLVLMLLLGSSSVMAIDDEIVKLQRQISARDSAMLEMQNRINAQEQSMRTLQGSIDDLNYKLAQMTENQKSLLSEIDALKQGAKYDQAPASAPVGVSAQQPKQDVTTVAKDNVAPTQVVSNNSTSNEAQNFYNSGVAKLNSGDFKGAESIFSSFINKYSDSPLVSNSYYWIGQINFREKKYPIAKENFLNVTKFKDSVKRAESIYKLGQISEALNENEKAKKFYQLVIQVYPDRTEAMLAKQALSKLK
jgi:tol-pal system protein YbgF